MDALIFLFFFMRTHFYTMGLREIIFDFLKPHCLRGVHTKKSMGFRTGE